MKYLIKLLIFIFLFSYVYAQDRYPYQRTFNTLKGNNKYLNSSDDEFKQKRF